ncbi:glyoxylase-like metal-dependent hydrolase (beta-lactamase superfamily II)/rhodanese-related sulfurtransferase [Dyadobacter sp. BE34]|uniref:Glyoxylase-like metal-dependent hydrolase (Beta-lactamase superfamily II)/rhodanese-related sulfurtransferase n=1 Tax=Dyadobacter fermentans TaxID=94254 RepID=A0ABU1R5Z7_9BACT|nr:MULTISPECIES: MBL fold metallo-hydrolase [Dyadobacter]MDR6808829.1 glyoxylase-like metal-dependent hydrolase (beta-lactamase superfamily II)/rhodanese-related sulfurtransferase [Dyadobacter fermentans]MDR7046572.1 glyoxylase-like metal-dependent hydrolase (beta-lactamase superfamily II)/rhodanese-related sulfurtransferase [Dyadobacter sp. BE242]MDR7200885.1 glyoxylase-like metal-dependent hydrolase (beta-lactamase superfamily II)/rhodanese-related sulfurtransferase [Dyadobacter sp. BE34]MDR7
MERRTFVMNMAGLGLASIATNLKVVARTLLSTASYTVEQFEDKGLAHFSYAVMAEKKVILIDPQRNPQIYYDFATKHGATIIGVIETHPHADFVSSHQEIHQTLKVPIYASGLTKCQYPLTAFDEGKVIKLSEKVGLRSLFTPGHAPDHIAVVLYEDGKDKMVFSGDSLFLGDVGRPDLLDYSPESDKQRRHLAELMYETIHEKFAKLDDDVIVYPSHGAGSLCGKSIRKAASSTIGYEKQNNYAFEKRSKAEFVNVLLSDQPFIPQYFAHDVHMNNQGAPAFEPSVSKIRQLSGNYQPEKGMLVIDVRPSQAFQKSYLDGAINIPGSGSMETWLGTLVSPNAKFYLVGSDESGIQTSLKKAASIGYEGNILGTIQYNAANGNHLSAFDKNSFDPANNKYTIVDVRTAKEAKSQPAFKSSLNIPLQEMPKRMAEIPTDKPVLIHCGSGYRSATAASLLKKQFPNAQVYDMGSSITEFISSNSAH